MVNLQWDTYMWIDTVQRGLGRFKLTEVSFAQTQQTVVLSEITGQLVKYFNTDLLLLLEKDELMLQSYSQIFKTWSPCRYVIVSHSSSWNPKTFWLKFKFILFWKDLLRKKIYS